MREHELDEMISNTLHTCGDAVEPSPALRTRVLANAGPRQKKRVSPFRRAVVACAAAAALAITGAVASSGVTGLRSALHLNQVTEDYDKLAAQVAQQVGEDVIFPETLGDAAFRKGYIDVVEKLGENNTSLGTFNELSATYDLDGSRIELNAYVYDPAVEGEAWGTDGKEVRKVNGVEVTYALDHYRSVPVDYELSEEELAAEEAHEIIYSVGSDEVEDDWFAFVSWEQNDICYFIADYDNVFEPDALFGFAAEIIQ